MRYDIKTLKQIMVAACGLLLVAGCTSSDSFVQSVRPLYQTQGEVAEASQYSMGKQYFSEGRYGLALEAFQAELSRNQRSVPALNGIAACYDQMKRYDLALSYYYKALQIQPDSVKTLSNLGYSYILQERIQEANKVLRLASHYNPEHERVKQHLAYIARTYPSLADAGTVDVQAEQQTETAPAMPEASAQLAMKERAEPVVKPVEEEVIAEPETEAVAATGPVVQSIEEPSPAREVAQTSGAKAADEPVRATDEVSSEGDADRGVLSSIGSFFKSVGEKMLAVISPEKRVEQADSAVSKTSDEPQIATTKHETAEVVSSAESSPLQINKGIEAAGQAGLDEPRRVVEAAVAEEIAVQQPDEAVAGLDAGQAVVENDSTIPLVGDLSVISPEKKVEQADAAEVEASDETPVAKTNHETAEAVRPAESSPLEMDKGVETAGQAGLDEPRRVVEAAVAEEIAIQQPDEAVAGLDAGQAVVESDSSIPLVDDLAVNDTAASSFDGKSKVEVSNGNGVAGHAHLLAIYLKGQGELVWRITNADSFGHKNSVIFYRPGNRLVAERLANKLPVEVTLKESMENYPGIAARLVLGEELVDYRASISREIKEQQSASLYAKDYNFRDEPVVVLAIEISNGNGADGMARLLRDVLTRQGKSIARVTNAESFGHDKTVIYYQPGRLNDALQVASELPVEARLEETDISKRRVNVRIIMGRDFINFKAAMESLVGKDA